MEQLLRIESVSAQLEIESVKAKLLIKSSRPKLNIVRNVKGLTIRTHPAKVKISSRGLRESILSLKSPLSLMKEHAAEGIRAAQEATATIAEEGNAMANHNTSIADIAVGRFIPMIDTALAFIPQGGVEISVSEPMVEINYTPDELQFHWDIRGPQFSYIPYDLQIRVKRYPKVNVEYVGKPQKFPNNPRLLEKQRKIFSGKTKV